MKGPFCFWDIPFQMSFLRKVPFTKMFFSQEPMWWRGRIWSLSSPGHKGEYDKWAAAYYIKEIGGFITTDKLSRKSTNQKGIRLN